MEKRIALMGGDGIGPEIAAQAVKVLRAVEGRFGHSFTFVEAEAPGAATDRCGDPLPPETLALCRGCDSVLLGNVGGGRWAGLPLEQKPERALFRLRKAFDVATNLRPITLYPALSERSPLKGRIARKGIDILVVRDVLGGALTGEKKTGRGPGGREASDLEYYNEEMIRRSARLAFQAAALRRRRVASLDKANALASSMLWRETVTEVGKDHPQVDLSHHLVDNAAMEVIRMPDQFDVIVASNLFGDIIADELSQLTGAAGLLGSAELGSRGGVFTPNQLHWPDETIVGRDRANPMGMVAAAALMLRYAFGLEAEAAAVERAVARTIGEGFATEDFALPGAAILGTEAMGDRLAAAVETEEG